MKQKKEKQSLKDRLIVSRQRGIDRMIENKKQIMQDAKTRCDELDARIGEKRLLLEAIKRGELKTAAQILREAAE